MQESRDALIQRVVQATPINEREILYNWFSFLPVPKRLPQETAEKLKKMGFTGFTATERTAELAKAASVPLTTKASTHFSDLFQFGTVAARVTAGDQAFDGVAADHDRIAYFHSDDVSTAQVVTAHPADYPGRPNHEGYLNFAHDLTYFMKYEKGAFVPAHTTAIYGTAGFNPARYCPEGMKAFLASFGGIFSDGLTGAGYSSAYIYAHIQNVLQTMSMACYLTIQTDFNRAVLRVEFAAGAPKLYQGGAFTQAVTLQNYQNYSDVPDGDKANHVARTGPLTDGMKMASTDRIALKYLAAARVVRGEDNDGPSYLSKGWKRGGHVLSSHRQVCDTLSLMLAYSREPNLLIRAPNKQTATIVMRYAAQRKMTVRFLVDFKDKADFLEYGVHDDSPTDFFIDMVSSTIPAGEKDQDPVPNWCRKFESELPKAERYIAIRKVPPSLIDTPSKLKFFQFQTAHAYDIIVTTELNLERVVGRFYGSTIQQFRQPLIQILTGQELRALQHDDNRAKTVGLFCGRAYTLDLGLNLWYPPLNAPVKKSLKKLVVAFEETQPNSRAPGQTQSQVPQLVVLTSFSAIAKPAVLQSFSFPSPQLSPPPSAPPVQAQVYVAPHAISPALPPVTALDPTIPQVSGATVPVQGDDDFDPDMPEYSS